MKHFVLCNCSHSEDQASAAHEPGSSRVLRPQASSWCGGYKLLALVLMYDAVLLQMSLSRAPKYGSSDRRGISGASARKDELIRSGSEEWEVVPHADSACYSSHAR